MDRSVKCTPPPLGGSVPSQTHCSSVSAPSLTTVQKKFSQSSELYICWLPVCYSV